MLKFIDFWAPWCGPCKIMDPVVAELKKEFEGKVEFEEINIDEHQDKAVEFGVMSIPTFVVLKDGQEVGRKIGVTAKTELQKLLQG
jgi:thioredoxin 1